MSPQSWYILSYLDIQLPVEGCELPLALVMLGAVKNGGPVMGSSIDQRAEIKQDGTKERIFL